MSDPNVKQIRLTSAAPPKKGGSRKKKGGGSTSPGTITQLQSSHVPGIPTLPVVGVDSSLTQQGAPAGGARVTSPVKVVLAAPKARAVVLTPKAAPAKNTRKASRSIKMSVSGLGKRLTRAKTIRKEAGALAIVDVKKVLQKAGLIKADSKAPEPILRQMYADYMMLKERAL